MRRTFDPYLSQMSLPLLCLILHIIPITALLEERQTTITASTLTIAGPTITTYIASPTTPPSPQYTEDLTLRTSVLNSTNLFRFQHNATYLSWNESLATYAANYSSQCIWAHSRSPQGYGENLARGYPDVTSAIDAWGYERDLYTFSPLNQLTGFTEATGHFTQLVWKHTQTVGCAAYPCNGMNDVGGYMLVCEYWPPGNVEGTGRDRNIFFESQVQSQVYQDVGTGSTTSYDILSATLGATGVGTSWATGTLVATTGGSGSWSGVTSAGVVSKVYKGQWLLISVMWSVILRIAIE